MGLSLLWWGSWLKLLKNHLFFQCNNNLPLLTYNTEFFSLSQVYEKRWFCGRRSNVATVGILPFLNYNLLLFSIVYGNFEIISLKMQCSFAVVWNQNRMPIQKFQLFSTGGSRPINETQVCSDTAEEKQCKYWKKAH